MTITRFSGTLAMTHRYADFVKLMCLLVAALADPGSALAQGWAPDCCTDQVGKDQIWLQPGFGVYYPDAYYSRQYLQQFPLQGDQDILYFRLRPYENYGQFRLGQPVQGLTNGTVDSNRYPYRYAYDFQAWQAPVPPLDDPCARPRLQRTLRPIGYQAAANRATPPGARTPEQTMVPAADRIPQAVPNGRRY